MRELYLHVPPNYTAQTTDNSHDFVYTQMQCVCMRYNYYKFTKIHNYIQSYTYLFLFCSFSEFMAYIYILVKYLNLKSVPMFWIYFLCSIKCIDFLKKKTCISNTRVCVSYEKSGPITTFGPDYFILLIIFYELKKITIIFMNFIYEKDRIFFL